MEPSLNDILMTCGICDFTEEGISTMENHLMDAHAYTPEDARQYATLWAEDAYDKWQAQEIERNEHYRMTGEDPFDESL